MDIIFSVYITISCIVCAALFVDVYKITAAKVTNRAIVTIIAAQTAIGMAPFWPIAIIAILLDL